MKNQLIKVIIVFFFSILFELIYFNYDFVYYILFNTPKKVIFAKENIELINWVTNIEGDIVSQADPIIYFHELNLTVKNVIIKIDSEHRVPYIDFFYTESVEPDTKEELRFIHFDNGFMKMGVYNINKHVRNFRIDLGNDEGLLLKDITIIFNESIIDFSVSRIVAMNMIYWISSILFIAQKSPKYDL